MLILYYGLGLSIKVSVGGKPDICPSSYSPKGSEWVRIEFKLDECEVLLSDFDLWHYVLNYWYLPESIDEGEIFEKELKRAGYSFYEDIPIPCQKYHDLIEKSWDKIFDIKWEEKDLTLLNDRKSIQAIFWELSLDSVVDVTRFIAK